MRKIIFLTILILGTILTAAEGDFVTLGENVESFLNNGSKNIETSHRSGLDINKSSFKSYSDAWSESYMSEYSVAADFSLAEKLKELFFSSKSVEKYDSFTNEKGEIRFQKKEVPMPSDLVIKSGTKIEIEDYIKLAEKKLYETFGEAIEGYEYSNYAIDEVSCVSCKDNSKMISGISIRFRRIFKGGIVDENTSYIRIEFDPDSSVRRLNVKWPEIKELSVKKSIRKINNSIDPVMTYFSELKEIRKGTEMLSVKNIEINSAARFWIAFENNGETVLSPGYSFIGTIHLEDGSIASAKTEASLIDEYYQNYLKSFSK